MTAAVEVARDCLDYIEAFGSLGSLLLAVVAAAFAWRSASDSSRSADAAEQTADAATEEAKLSRQMVERLEEQLEIERATRAELEQERGRRPVFVAPALDWLGRLDPGELTVGLLHDMGVQPGIGGVVAGVEPVIVRARFLNAGEKVADQVLVRCLVPQGVVPLECGPRGDIRGRPDLRVADSVTLQTPSGEVQAREFSWRIAHLPPNQPEDTHLNLVLRSTGGHEIVIEVGHPESDTVSAKFMVSADAVRSADDDESSPS